MVEVGGRPVLWHIMKHLGVHGIDEFIIAAGYKAELIKQYFLDYDARNNDFTIELGKRGALRFHGNHEESDWTVTVADTGPATLTGGRVLRASRYLDASPFMVTYGDGLANVDVGSLLEHHRRHGRLATVTTVQPTSRFGVLDTDEDGHVTAFREKPQLEGWVNIGFFVFEPDALRYLQDDCPLETTPLERLAEASELSAFQHRGFWQPMDTYRESQMLNEMWESGSPPWKTWN